MPFLFDKAIKLSFIQSESITPEAWANRMLVTQALPIEQRRVRLALISAEIKALSGRGDLSLSSSNQQIFLY
jgi:hypothetical protein